LNFFRKKKLLERATILEGRNGCLVLVTMCLRHRYLALWKPPCRIMMGINYSEYMKLDHEATRMCLYHVACIERINSYSARTFHHFLRRVHEGQYNRTFKSYPVWDLKNLGSLVGWLEQAFSFIVETENTTFTRPELYRLSSHHCIQLTYSPQHVKHRFCWFRLHSGCDWMVKWDVSFPVESQDESISWMAGHSF
jgi:hypothetical protein